MCTYCTELSITYTISIYNHLYRISIYNTRTAGDAGDATAARRHGGGGAMQRRRWGARRRDSRERLANVWSDRVHPLNAMALHVYCIIYIVCKSIVYAVEAAALPCSSFLSLSHPPYFYSLNFLARATKPRFLFIKTYSYT